MHNTDYSLLKKQYNALMGQETNFVANMANLSALLYEQLPDVNWVGFYLYNTATKQLILGPFQGKPACIRIDFGKGVCGTAAKEQKTLIVPDVHAFPGHIACDAASNSEIVVPVIKKGTFYAVLDLDSPHKNRFTHADKEGLESIIESFSKQTFLRHL